MAGAHYRLDNLTVVVDRNRLQQGARTEETNGLDPLDAKLAAFGWEVREVDGHDYAALLEAFARPTTGKPRRDHRQHDQGQGRLVHGGSRGVAPQGAERRTGQLALEELS